MAYETAASSAAAASASKTFYICVMYKLQLHYNVQITKCCSKFNIEFSAVPARCYIWYWKASLQTCVLLIDEQKKHLKANVEVLPSASTWSLLYSVHLIHSGPRCGEGLISGSWLLETKSRLEIWKVTLYNFLPLI